MIYVFGSNLKGDHDTEYGLLAMRDYGAEPGNAIGLSGSSYAIPVRGYRKRLLPLGEIESYVDDFLDYAEDNPHTAFLITPVGCEQTMLNAPSISILFKDAPKNCIFDRCWKFWLGNSFEYQE